MKIRITKLLDLLLESKYLKLESIQADYDITSAEFIRLVEDIDIGKKDSNSQEEPVAQAASIVEKYLEKLPPESDEESLKNCIELESFLADNLDWASTTKGLDSKAHQFLEKIEAFIGKASDEEKQKSYFKLGRAAFNSGNLEKALVLFESADETLPNPNIKYNKCLILQRLGQDFSLQYIKARNMLKKEAHKESTKLLNNMGIYYYKLKQYEDARKFFEDAVRADPDNRAANLNLGLICYEKGDGEEDIKKAIEHLEKANEAISSGVISNYLAQAYLNIGELEKAKEHAIKYTTDFMKRMSGEDD